MPTTEHTLNDAIANLLRKTRRIWRPDGVVSSENTGMLKGNSKRPDILIVEDNVSPVVIETEVLPAVTVEAEALDRLGEELRATGRKILSSIAVRLPLRLRSEQGSRILSELQGSFDIEMALFTGAKGEGAIRWPHQGWVVGGLADLSLLVQLASVPPDIIEKAADELVAGVTETAGLLEALAAAHPGAVHKISEELHQEDGGQTRRMAIAILANAFVFQESLAGGPGILAEVKSIEQLRGATGKELGKSVVLAEWRKILKVNYWPIFDIARRILEVIPGEGCRAIIDRLALTAEKLLENRLMRSHDLTGAVFQRLIADRKFLAAYYTTPASAALLIGLAVTQDRPLSGGSWSNPDEIKNLRIADFACGTGTLLSTGYQRIGQLHELFGGDAEALHPEMMAKAIVGCDVLPAAAHLTASMLAGSHPTVKYKQSCIMTVEFGKQENGGIALGSLDLLDPQKELDIVAISAKAAGGTGELKDNTNLDLPDETFDLVVMNPPFTRNVGQEGKKIGVPNPMFAAFSSSKEDQRLMAKATERLTSGTCGHGNAGEASYFLALADRKVKPGGTLALVMPLSLLSGDAWEDSRILLSKNYRDLVLVSIAGLGSDEMSFSADTGMGECLVIGRKETVKNKRATFVILKERPAYPLQGVNVAGQIRNLILSQTLQRLEDGPVGGTKLHFGDDAIGEALDAPLPVSGPWNPTRIADLSLAQAAYQLADSSRIWLPGMKRSQSKIIPITAINSIATFGPYHADINFMQPNGQIRGPFEISELKEKDVPTYPILWSHVADRERSLQFEADCEALPRKGKTSLDRAIIEEKISKIKVTASFCHFNQNFQFNSQSTAMQFTTRRTIGGRAWLSIKLKSEEQEKALVTWGNTSLGLLLHWFFSNKQQSGRGNTVPSQLKALPVLDVTKLKKNQLKEAVKIFDDICKRPLLPVNEIDQDSLRKELDERFSKDVLELPSTFMASGGPLELLRMKLAHEPSIRGTKAIGKHEDE